MDTSSIKLGADKNGLGSVAIADEVVEMIASLAASEVKGVTAMVGNITNELMSKVGVKNLTKGTKVDVLDKMVTLDLSVRLEYGYSIPDVGTKVQEKVKSAIETMTGMQVTDVNVSVTDVVTGGDETEG